jgi:competence protein ComEA
MIRPSEWRVAFRQSASLVFGQLVLLTFIPVLPAAGPPTGWEQLDGCRLVPSSSNDGDSFHVRHGSNEFTVRLYFVDAPEKNAEFPDRNQAQADYFEIAVEEVPKWGHEAEAFTREFLDGPFTLYSQWEDGMGRGRRYLAVIERNGESLAEALVGAGLARLHGFQPSSPWPGAVSLERVHGRLAAAEREAKRQHLGCWGGSPALLADSGEQLDDSSRGERSSSPTPVQSVGLAPPTLVVPQYVTNTPVVVPSANTTNDASYRRADVSGPLDLNTATAAELERLPGIGRVYATAIISGRPWKTVGDLTKIPGIGPAAVNRLRPLVRVGPGRAGDYLTRAVPLASDEKEDLGIEGPSAPVLPRSAAYYRVEAERWRGQKVEVSIRGVTPVEHPAPAGFAVLLADTGTADTSGGRMLFFLPEERLEAALNAFQRSHEPIVVSVIFHHLDGEDVLVMPRP